MYTYYSAEERKTLQSDIKTYTGWAKEAAGGDEGDRYCYNCAKVSLSRLLLTNALMKPA